MLTKSDLDKISKIVQKETLAIVRKETPAIVRKETLAIIRKETPVIVQKETTKIVKQEILSSETRLNKKLKKIENKIEEHLGLDPVAI